MEQLNHPNMPPRSDLYNFTIVFPLEDIFEDDPANEWMQKYWYSSFMLSFVYATMIFIGQKIMSTRPAFKLNSILFYWNAALAIFSILGALRMSPEFYHVLMNRGFQYSVCTSGYAKIGVTAFWIKAFSFSKAFELIDTIFIVLRKRPLIFLHWYHHITVLIYTWHAVKDHTAAGRWFIWMNFQVHAFMYSYYALRSIGWRFPKWIPMSLTVMQLAQMVVGCVVNFEVYRTKTEGKFCQQTYGNLYFSFGIYFTYFLLFARFFYDVYLKKGNRYQKWETKFKHEKEGIEEEVNKKVKVQ